MDNNVEHIGTHLIQNQIKSTNDINLQRETQPTSHTDEPKKSLAHRKHQIRVWHIGNILLSDPDYEWWIYNHAFITNQSEGT